MKAVSPLRLLAFLIDLITGLFGFPTDMQGDLANRNDRGRFKPDSDKYVTR